MVRAPLLLVLALCGCATGGLATGTAPTTTHLETQTGVISVTSVADERVASHALPASADRVWSVLPAAFEAVGLRGGTVSGAGRVYGTGLMRFRGRLAGERGSRSLSCGTNPIGAAAADMYDVEANVRAAVLPGAEGASQLQLLVEASATHPAGGGRTACASTRRLEERILAEVRARLADG